MTKSWHLPTPVPQQDENENEKKQNTHATFNL